MLAHLAVDHSVRRRLKYQQTDCYSCKLRECPAILWRVGTENFVPARWAGPFYDAAVSTTALDVCPDFRFVWPSPLFFASADRVAAYSGATIG